MTTIALTADEFNALVTKRDAVATDRERLQGKLRTVCYRRARPLQESVKAMPRKLFAGKSKACGTEQEELFLNEVEILTLAAATPITEEVTVDDIEIADHTRKKRGRKPLAPSLPREREVVRHELCQW